MAAAAWALAGSYSKVARAVWTGIEAERELTSLAPRVEAWVVSRIPIMKGLVDFLAARGRRPLWFNRARV